MTLVRREYGGVVRDLLAPVGGKDVEFIVIYSNFVVGISRIYSDLEVGGEEIGNGGDVKSIDGGVLEDEAGFFGLQHSPDDEKGE